MNFKQFLSFALPMFPLIANAQEKKSQITITQSVTLQSSSPGRQNITNEVMFYIKETKAKSYSKQGPAVIEVFYNHTTGESINRVDMMGNKQKNSTPDFHKSQKAEYSKAEIEYTNETKTVAGVECKKAWVILTKGDLTEKRYVWYNPFVTSPFPYSFGVVGLDLIKGLPMEYENKMQGFVMVYTVTKLDTELVVADSNFEDF